jgi:hypothetical protein
MPPPGVSSTIKSSGFIVRFRESENGLPLIVHRLGKPGPPPANLSGPLARPTGDAFRTQGRRVQAKRDDLTVAASLRALIPGIFP